MAIEEVIRSKETELLNLYNYQSVLVLDLSLDWTVSGEVANE